MVAKLWEALKDVPRCLALVLRGNGVARLPIDFENVGARTMGGYGSGTWRDRGAGRCEQYLRVDLAYLNRQRLLRTHNSGSLRWSLGGQETGNIGFVVLPQALRLIYRTRRYGEDEWKPVEEDVPFSWTNTAFEGRRRWLLCLSCYRNCRILYGGTHFRCRKCHRLVYASQYENAWQRAITRAQDVRMRLGGSGSMDEPFPPKPKGMHWRTYWGLEEQDQIADEFWARSVMRWLARMPH